jgi:hypothetical protein
MPPSSRGQPKSTRLPTGRRMRRLALSAVAVLVASPAEPHPGPVLFVAASAGVPACG